MNQEADPLWTVNLLAPWPWTSQFPELWEIHFCCSWATWLQYFVTVAWTDVEQQCQQHFCCGDGRGTQGSETELSEVGRCGLSMLFKHFLPRRTLNIVDAANMALANCFPYPCDLKTAGTRAAPWGGRFCCDCPAGAHLSCQLTTPKSDVNTCLSGIGHLGELVSSTSLEKKRLNEFISQGHITPINWSYASIHLSSTFFFHLK